MPVKIHNKDYLTVAERVASFRKEHPDWGIETRLMSADDECVVMMCRIIQPMEAGEHQVISVGHAEEVRSASKINRTSALENAETSAVGRALAFYGLSGTEIASADEVAGALKQQSAQELIDYNALVREHWHTIAEVKNLLHPQWGELENRPNVTDARRILKAAGNDVHNGLWKAPTKGGIFTTVERTLLKEPERSVEIYGVESL